MTALLQQPSQASLSSKFFSENLLLSKDGVFLTIQGEGPRLGQLTTFLRLAGCNLNCNWCDTAYTWDWAGKNGIKYDPKVEAITTPLFKVAREVNDKFSTSLTVTGGEPLLQNKNLDELFWNLARLWDVPSDNRRFKEINFETNGTVIPQWSPGALEAASKFHYVVSPKLRNSGCPIMDTPFKQHLQWWAEGPNTDFKFVCTAVTDLDEVEALVKYARILPGQVWIMGEGWTAGIVNNRNQELVSEVIRRGWNLTTRFHLQLWGNLRAR